MGDISGVTKDRQGAIVRVILNRPNARNALNLEMCQALQKRFQEIEEDQSVNAVLVSANGPSFCAGADVKERAGRGAAWVRSRRLAAYAAYRSIQTCSRPVVILVHGNVIGSGGEIAMSGDFIIAAQGTVFRFPEPQLGTVGATQRLQRMVGVQRAKDLLLTGRSLPVEEAISAGLVARIVPVEDLESVGIETVERIASASPLAMRLTKQAMDLGRETDLDRAIGIELAAVERNLASGAGDLANSSTDNDEN